MSTVGVVPQTTPWPPLVVPPLDEPAPLLVWPPLEEDEVIPPLLLLLVEPLDPLPPLLDPTPLEPESSPLLPPELLLELPPGSVKPVLEGLLLQASAHALARVTIQAFVFMILRPSGRYPRGSAQRRVRQGPAGLDGDPACPKPKHG
jgi:hypothetical protein